MGHFTFNELIGGHVPPGMASLRPDGSCVVGEPDGMVVVRDRRARVCRQLQQQEQRGLSGLGAAPGWFGGKIQPPARSFRAGLNMLGGGSRARTYMNEIWAHRRPAGFWGGARGEAWKRVSPGNMTPAMLRELLKEIQQYEDRSVSDRFRVTPPGSHKRRPRTRPTPAPTPPPRPTPAPDLPAPTLVATAWANRSVTRAAPQPYARQARSGVPTGGTPWSSGTYVSVQ